MVPVKVCPFVVFIYFAPVLSIGRDIQEPSASEIHFIFTEQQNV